MTEKNGPDENKILPFPTQNPADSLIVPDGYYFNFIAEDPEDADIREAMRKVRDKRKQDPDYIKKQMDGVLPPKPIISPEHYHISYEYDGATYPHTAVGFRRSREAYLELWRVQSLAAMFGEPEFYEEGFIDISTPLKGRTGVHRIRLRVVECFLLGCANQPSPLQPMLELMQGDVRR